MGKYKVCPNCRGKSAEALIAGKEGFKKNCVVCNNEGEVYIPSKKELKNK